MEKDRNHHQFAWIVERLLVLLSEIAISGADSERTSRFRNELMEYRRLLLEHEAGESIDTTARKCLAACQDFFHHFAASRHRNDKEYGLIIDILRQAIATLSAGASLHSAVLGSAQRFRELARLDDLQELRHRIAEEVLDLERNVRSKQIETERFTASLSDRLERLESKLSDTESKLRKTESETSIDALTAISNRRHFDRQLEVWTAAQHRIGPFVLAMIDIDNFKNVNDQYGHRAGDIVLSGVARTMRSVIRNNDVLARYGGEEFAILFGNITLEMAEERCERILSAVRSARFEVAGVEGHLTVTLSCGLTAFERGDTPETLMHRSDIALYTAKQRGRNRVEIRRKPPISLFRPTPAETPGRKVT